MSAPAPGPAKIDTQEAAKVTEEVEQQLQSLGEQQGEPALEQREADKTQAGPGDVEGSFSDTEQLVQSWKQRLTILEGKTDSSSSTAPPPGAEDIEELQSIAEGVQRYRKMLIDDCGYRNKDLKEDPDLPALEARLDKLSEVILKDVTNPPPSLEEEEKNLIAWASEQTERLAEKASETTNLSPSERKEVEQLVKDIVDLRAKFKAEGLTQHEQDKHDDMQALVWRLRELRHKDMRDKKHDGRQVPETDAVKQEAEELKKQIQEHKNRLIEEQKLTQKDIKEDPTLTKLEEKYNTLCQIAGA